MNKHRHTPSDTQCLQQSYEHWRDNQKLEESDKFYPRGAIYCACCVRQAREQAVCYGEGMMADFSCDGCPIQAYTGKDDCRGTPFYHGSAKNMADWLQSLLEGGSPEIWD